MANILYTSHT